MKHLDKFIEERLVQAENRSIQSATLYNEYLQWTNSNGFIRLNRKQFPHYLQLAIPDLERVKQSSIRYFGIRFKNQKELSELTGSKIQVEDKEKIHKCSTNKATVDVRNEILNCLSKVQGEITRRVLIDYFKATLNMIISLTKMSYYLTCLVRDGSLTKQKDGYFVSYILTIDVKEKESSILQEDRMKNLEEQVAKQQQQINLLIATLIGSSNKLKEALGL